MVLIDEFWGMLLSFMMLKLNCFLCNLFELNYTDETVT